MADIDCLKKKIEEAENIEYMIHANFEDMETRKVGSLLQTFQIENKLH